MPNYIDVMDKLDKIDKELEMLKSILYGMMSEDKHDD